MEIFRVIKKSPLEDKPYKNLWEPRRRLTKAEPINPVWPVTIGTRDWLDTINV